MDSGELTQEVAADQGAQSVVHTFQGELGDERKLAARFLSPAIDQTQHAQNTVVAAAHRLVL